MRIICIAFISFLTFVHAVNADSKTSSGLEIQLKKIRDELNGYVKEHGFLALTLRPNREGALVDLPPGESDYLKRRVFDIVAEPQSSTFSIKISLMVERDKKGQFVFGVLNEAVQLRKVFEFKEVFSLLRNSKKCWVTVVYGDYHLGDDEVFPAFLVFLTAVPGETMYICAASALENGGVENANEILKEAPVTSLMHARPMLHRSSDGKAIPLFRITGGSAK